MIGPTIVWGAVADQLGHCHWERYERTADGCGVNRVEQWAEEPADEYARSHPAPLPAKWCHGSDLGRVIALRRMHGKLFAVAELDEVTAADLDELAARNGPLRWSASTRKVGRGPWAGAADGSTCSRSTRSTTGCRRCPRTRLPVCAAPVAICGPPNIRLRKPAGIAVSCGTARTASRTGSGEGGHSHVRADQAP